MFELIIASKDDCSLFSVMCTCEEYSAWPPCSTYVSLPPLHTLLLQCDNHGARSEGVPGSAVVRGVEVWLHDIVDGQGGENSPALRWRFTLLHCVPLH